MLTEPMVNGGNHPLFTFNAFAFSGPEFGIPDKIVMGDGVLDGFKALGFDDVALAGHLRSRVRAPHPVRAWLHRRAPPGADRATVDEAELTRHNELMADAFSAYYLTHSRGAR